MQPELAPGVLDSLECKCVRHLLSALNLWATSRQPHMPPPSGQRLWIQCDTFQELRIQVSLYSDLMILVSVLLSAGDYLPTKGETTKWRAYLAGREIIKASVPLPYGYFLFQIHLEQQITSWFLLLRFCGPHGRGDASNQRKEDSPLIIVIRVWAVQADDLSTISCLWIMFTATATSYIMRF